MNTNKCLENINKDKISCKHKQTSQEELTKIATDHIGDNEPRLVYGKLPRELYVNVREKIEEIEMNLMESYS